MDKFTIEVLEDGTVKTTTDKISAPNHQSAEHFMAMLAKFCGGPVTRVRRNEGLHHHHHHEHGEHTHTH